MRVETTVSPIAVIQAFSVEQTEGQPTTPQRRDLPMAHGDAVLARIAGLPRRLGEIVAGSLMTKRDRLLASLHSAKATATGSSSRCIHPMRRVRPQIPLAHRAP